MRLLVLLLMMVFLDCFGQNNLIIYNTDTSRFYVSSPQLDIENKAYHDVKLSNLTSDTIQLEIKKIGSSSSQKLTALLLQKKRPVVNKEFVYAISEKGNTKQFELKYISCYDIAHMPSPLVPPEPIKDTTPKWQDKPYGNIFWLSKGKVSFYQNRIPDKACKDSIKEEDMGYIKQLMKKVQTEYDRVNYLSEITLKNCLSTNQLRTLLIDFNYELDKFKLISACQNNICDQSRYHTLESLFKFESMKTRFREHLKQGIMPGMPLPDCSSNLPDSVVMAIYKEVKMQDDDFSKSQYLLNKKEQLCLSIIQLKDILNLFKHDRDKAEMVKALYPRITDKENLPALKEIFTYPESYEQLNSFFNE